MNLVKQPNRLFIKKKKVVLREEFMELTKDLSQALVLSQMMYWTKKIDNLNDLILEENKRLAEHGQMQIEYFHGWIWKSARQMKEELFNSMSEDTIQRAFSALSEKGIFVKRRNPKFKYDRTLQYRIDLVLLRRRLKDIGIEFTDFQLNTIPHGAELNPLIAELKPSNAVTIPEITIENTLENIKPLTPLKGEVENSAEASSSTNDFFNTNESQRATAQASEAKASDSRPPRSMKTQGLRKSSVPPPKPDGITEQTWEAFCDIRKEKKAKITPAVLNIIQSEAQKAGWPLEDALRECVLRGWRGFKAEWVSNQKKPQPTNQSFEEIDWSTVKPNL
jgi:hypothetical protein